MSPNSNLDMMRVSHGLAVKMNLVDVPELRGKAAPRGAPVPRDGARRHAIFVNVDIVAPRRATSVPVAEVRMTEHAALSTHLRSIASRERRTGG